MDSSKINRTHVGFIGLVELYTTGLQPMAIHIQPLCGWLSILYSIRSLRFAMGLPCEIVSKFHRVNVAKQKEEIFYTFYNIFCMQVFQLCNADIIQPW